MKIEHIAIYTKDLERMKQFYITYFQGVSNQGYHNEKTGLCTYFVSFEGGARLELMTRPELYQKEIPNSSGYITGYTHLAFSVGSRDAVDLLTDRLEQDGYPVVSRPRVTGDGYYESGVLDPDGNYIEITE